MQEKEIDVEVEKEIYEDVVIDQFRYLRNFYSSRDGNSPNREKFRLAQCMNINEQ